MSELALKKDYTQDELLTWMKAHKSAVLMLVKADQFFHPEQWTEERINRVREFLAA